MLKISEQFYSIQGEGLTMGRPALFLRLHMCNLNCGAVRLGKLAKKENLTQDDVEKEWDKDSAKWYCDSTHVWLKGNEWSTQEIINKWKEEGWIDKLEKGATLVITGGEPLMQQGPIIELLEALPEVYVEFETNGTIIPFEALNKYVDHYNVSPKLENSGNPKTLRYQPDVLKWHAESGKSYFKFVTLDDEDTKEIISDFIKEFNIPNRFIYLMPGAASRKELETNSVKIAELCKENCWNMSTRMHLTIWDRVTGV